MKNLSQTRPTSTPPNRKTLKAWRHYWQDEADAAFLYRALADTDTASERRDFYLRLIDVEDRHTEIWQQLLAEYGVKVGKSHPSLRARLIAWIARHFGSSTPLSILLREEGREVKGYLNLHRESTIDSVKETALTLAKESAEHAMSLGKITGKHGEPWHKTASGGLLGDVVYGFNDGLTANFGLVMGVIGAAVEPHIIMMTGVVGMIADALSMGSSGYLAAKSEQEVYDYEIGMEKEEIRLMPEVEEEELALLYEAKGIEPSQAKQMAHDVMSDPKRALDEKVKEELKIGERYTTPLKEGWITGTATAIGAFIPVAPFLILTGSAAIWTSITLSMLSHFGVGAARSVFTGRRLIRSGFDMFVVGLGIAVIGYFVGKLVEKWLF